MSDEIIERLRKKEAFKASECDARQLAFDHAEKEER